MNVVLHGAGGRRRAAQERLLLHHDGRRPGRASRRRQRGPSYAAAAWRKSALPSGRTTYRRLDDYNQEMKDLAAKNPAIVKPLTLP